MIRIDERRCIRCGLCERDCISGVFVLDGDLPIPLHPERCNRCSHCIAVCPKRAVLHDGFPAAPPRRVQRRYLLSRAYRETAMSRRSIRRYRGEPVPRELIEELLDLARYAPTASNAQNVHYTVVTDRELLDVVSRRIFALGDRIYRLLETKGARRVRRLFSSLEAARAVGRYAESWLYYREQAAAGRDLLFHGAPVLVILHAPKGQSLARDNCVIAASTIANHAHTLGLGSCFVGLLLFAFRFDRSLRSRLGVPPAHAAHAVLALGYPALAHTYHVHRKPAAVRWIGPQEQEDRP